MNSSKARGSYFGESADVRTPGLVESKSSFETNNGGEKNFNEKFADLYESYKIHQGYDLKMRPETWIHDDAFMESYKNDLLEPVFESWRNHCQDDPHIQASIDNVTKLWDAKVKNFTESANIPAFLPISTLEFPVLVKQYFASVMKDIIDVETVKTPTITKHIKTTFLVDNNTGDEYEYPKCFFDGTWEKVWDAAKGHKIKNDVVALPVHNYDVVDKLTDGWTRRDKLSYNISISAIEVGGKVYQLRGNAITVDFATGGLFVNGDLDYTEDDGTVILDTITGKVNFVKGTVSVSSCTGQITGVVFSGYLSNENNIRNVSVREQRDLVNYQIEDGPRWSMPFTIEEIEDSSAMLDINYYNRMVDEIVKTQELVENQDVLRFYDEQYAKYKGMNTDIFKLESIVQYKEVNLQVPTGYAGDPFTYKSKAIQFALKAMIYSLTEAAKVDKLAFVVAGNPMATQLIEEFTTWKIQAGTQIGGIAVNNSYGFMSDMSAPVRVVATNAIAAYTKDVVTPQIPIAGYTPARELELRVMAFSTDPERLTFKHLKYTSHLLTSQSQTAYSNVNTPSGAYNYVTGISRYTNISLQGIMGRLVLMNSAVVYGPLN